MTIELVANYACRVGENPLWNPLDRCVYWLDIPTGTIYRYDPATQVHEIVYQGDLTGGFTIQDDGSFLLFGVEGRVSHLHQGKLTTIIDRIAGEENNRFNDVIADPSGGVLCGTVPNNGDSTFGSLYHLRPDGSITQVRTKIPFSNGMGFSPDQTIFYHADSKARTVTQFRYDVNTGELSQPRHFAILSPHDGVPDGLTVDAEGYVWLAVWDGSRLIRYDPEGNIEREIPFDVKKVSNLTFGGDDASDIYVSTAGGEKPSENGELAGALFRLQLGIRGRPEYLSRIRIPE